MTILSQESSTITIDDSSNPYVVDELTTADELTTDEILMKIEYNTRMTSLGVSHIFSVGLVLIGALAVWVIFHKWFFGGV
jgi:hypothetical protein